MVKQQTVNLHDLGSNPSRPSIQKRGRKMGKEILEKSSKIKITKPSCKVGIKNKKSGPVGGGRKSGPVGGPILDGRRNEI